MPTLYAVHGIGPFNWSDASSWSTISAKDASRVGNASAAPTATDDCVIDDYSGNLAIVATSYAKSANFTGYTGTLTWGTFSLQPSGSITFSTGMTITATSGAGLTMQANGTLTCGGKTLANIVLNAGTTTLGDTLRLSGNFTKGGSAPFAHGNQEVIFTGTAPTITGSPTFYKLTYTGTDIKTNVVSLAGDIAVTNALTLTGYSATSRPIIQSSVIGTPRIITCSGATYAVNDCDLQDIELRPAAATGRTITGAASDGGTGTRFATTSAHGLLSGMKVKISGTTNYNGNKVVSNVSDTTHFDIADAYVSSQAGAWVYDLTNGAANLIGDCGGNAGIGFTPSTTQTWADATGSWSDVTKWTSRVPLPQDLVRFGAMTAGRTITVDMPRLPDTDFSGATNTPAVTLNSPSLNCDFYGSLNLTGVGTLTNSTSGVRLFTRTGSTLTSAGKSTIIPAGFNLVVNAPSSTVTLLDALTHSSQTYVNYGTLTTAYSVTATKLTVVAGATLNMGTAMWTLSVTTGNVVNNTGTINGSGSTIALTYTGATAIAFVGGTGTFGDIVITPGSGVLTFSGAFTFHDMYMASAGAKKILFTKSTTYTQTGTRFPVGTADAAAIITGATLNGDFETWTTSTNAANWLESYGGTSYINQETTNPHSGTSCCRVDVGDTIVSMTMPGVLTVGSLYKYTFWARATDSTVVMAVLGSGVSSQTNFTLSSTWTQYTGYIIADTTGIQLKRITSGKSFWIDDVVLQPTNAIVIDSDDGATQFTLQGQQTVAADYLALKNSKGLGPGYWAGVNSVNLGNNTGWIFLPQPTAGPVRRSFNGGFN